MVHPPSEKDRAGFRSKRAEWVKVFEDTFTKLYEKRLTGVRRSGRRPDFDASLTTLRVLNAFDQGKQAALTAATDLIRRITRREAEAVDMRVGVLMREPRARDVDSPFAPDYVLDAIGVASRSLYPNPRIWRPLMERVLRLAQFRHADVERQQFVGGVGSRFLEQLLECRQQLRIVAGADRCAPATRP